MPARSPSRPTRATGATPVCSLPNPWSAGCPSREVLDLLADKWVLLLVPLLHDGPRRNGDLLRGAEGISQKMLTQTLRSLVQHGLVTRRDFGEIPPRVEYALTPLGRSLSSTLGALDAWVVAHFGEIDSARRQYKRPRTPSRMRAP
jgi:DNA-binding HxlR family transcriptional regulator